MNTQDLRYDSTRGGEKNVTASHAILQGLAADGGLFVPQTFPRPEKTLAQLAELPYTELAYEILRLYLTDFPEEALRRCIEEAYGKGFDIPSICAMKEADDAHFLELFHGKTIAFKDMALSILPHLMKTAASICAEEREIVILAATSGDTGKAALEGFADVPGTSIVTFYPKEGVSTIQERQMITQKGANTHVIAIRGNFDDAQNGVKEIFNNTALQEELLQKGILLSSANSINIGRLIPQVVYYYYAYAQLLRGKTIEEGDPMNVVVPTGNFGNILAAYIGKQMGLPIAELICASNTNKVLFDFFRTAKYDRNRPFFVTSSPSMDILISSNLERLLFLSAERDAAATAERMAELSASGTYTVSEAMRRNTEDFYGGYATEDEVRETIRRIYEQDGYVIDPHTAVGASVYQKYRAESGDKTPTVIASTASPYKFGDAVLDAIRPGEYDALPEEEKIAALHKISGVPVPAAVDGLMQAEILHHKVVAPEEMQSAMLECVQDLIRPNRPTP